MDGQSVELAVPAWGALPVEQYILRRWDRTSHFPHDEQRRKLVRAFIMEDDITRFSTRAEEWASDEAQELVRDVLIPWRAQQLRRIGARYVAESHMLFGELFLLRTHYSGIVADDEKLREWVEEAHPEDGFGGPENHWWRVLNYPTLLDLGSAGWQAVYEILPELAAPGIHRAFGGSEEAGLVMAAAYALEDDEPSEEDFRDIIMRHASMAPGFLLIADQEAFEEGMLGLVFRDNKGRVVKEGRVKHSEVERLDDYNCRGALRESELWLNAVAGEKYRKGGDIIEALLPLAMTES